MIREWLKLGPKMSIFFFLEEAVNYECRQTAYANDCPFPSTLTYNLLRYTIDFMPWLRTYSLQALPNMRDKMESENRQARKRERTQQTAVTSFGQISGYEIRA